MSNGEKKFWEVKASASGDNIGELYIYGDIVSYQWWDEDVAPTSFKDDLDSLSDKDTINIYLNSPGGSVFAGQTIYSMIKRHKANVNIHIDGLAASIASVIAMAGNKVIMPKNAMMMIHNPWTWSAGNAQDFRKQADDLDKIKESILEAYLSKAKNIDRDKLSELMDGETWLTAQECYDYGLCDELVEDNEAVASISSELFNNYTNVPKNLLDNKPQPAPKIISNKKDNTEDAEKEIEAMKTYKNYLSRVAKTRGSFFN